MFELLIKILTNTIDTLIKQGLADAANRKKRAARELYSVYQLLHHYSLALERVSQNLNPAYSPTWIASCVEGYVTEITKMMRELFLFFDDPQFSSLKIGNPEARAFFSDVVMGSHRRLKKIWEKKGFDPAKLEIWDRDLFDLLNIVAGDDIDIWFYLNAISLIDRDEDKIYMYSLSKLGDIERLFNVFPGIAMMVRRGLTETPPLPVPKDYPYRTVRDEFMKYPDDGTLKVLDLKNAEDITFFKNLLIEHKRMIEATREKLGSFIKEHFSIEDVL